MLTSSRRVQWKFQVGEVSCKVMSSGKVLRVDPRQCWSKPRGLHSLAHRIPGSSRQAHSPRAPGFRKHLQKAELCSLALRRGMRAQSKPLLPLLLWDKRPIFLQLLKEKGGDKSLRISAKWIWILYKLCVGWRQRLVGNICSYWTLRSSCSWSPGHRRLTLLLCDVTILETASLQYASRPCSPEIFRL